MEDKWTCDFCDKQFSYDAKMCSNDSGDTIRCEECFNNLIGGLEARYDLIKESEGE